MFIKNNRREETHKVSTIHTELLKADRVIYYIITAGFSPTGLLMKSFTQAVLDFIAPPSGQYMYCLQYTIVTQCTVL